MRPMRAPTVASVLVFVAAVQAPRRRVRYSIVPEKDVRESFSDPVPRLTNDVTSKGIIEPGDRM